VTETPTVAVGTEWGQMSPDKRLSLDPFSRRPAAGPPRRRPAEGVLTGAAQRGFV